VSEYLYTTPPIDRAVGVRRHVMTTSMRSFGGWGYREIQVPLLHYFEALRDGLDDEQIERSFRFVDRAGNLMVLRPDVTPVIAQTFAQMRSPQLPFRVSYTHKIVRIERSFTRDQLESYQLGIEHIGGDELLADVEVLLVAFEVMERLGLSDFQISIADHHIANYLLKACGAPSRIRDQIRGALVARDEDEARALLNRLGARSEYVQGILAMASLKGGPEQLQQIRYAFPSDRTVQRRLDYLERLISVLDDLGWGDRYRLELAELTGSSYYTGIGFVLLSEGASRELGRGGRYDSLIGMYGKQTPAVGFSLSLDTVVQALEPTSNHFSEAEAAEELCSVDPNDPVEGFRAALKLRESDQLLKLVEQGGVE